MKTSMGTPEKKQGIEGLGWDRRPNQTRSKRPLYSVCATRHTPRSFLGCMGQHATSGTANTTLDLGIQSVQLLRLEPSNMHMFNLFAGHQTGKLTCRRIGQQTKSPKSRDSGSESTHCVGDPLQRGDARPPQFWLGPGILSAATTACFKLHICLKMRNHPTQAFLGFPLKHQEGHLCVCVCALAALKRRLLGQSKGQTHSTCHSFGPNDVFFHQGPITMWRAIL